MLQQDYKEKVINCSKDFVKVEIDDPTINKVEEFSKEVVKIKLQERHHFIDSSQEIKRWKNGFLGEFAVEKFIEKRFVDLSIGDSKKYHISDLTKIGLDWGIKTVEYGKFPIIFKKSYKEEIIVIKKTDAIFYICGLATTEVLNKYQSDELILSPGLRAKGTKTGFYGFSALKSPSYIKKYISSVNN
jgi:hypothetical protein